MRVYHNVCCGIDVHKKSGTACLMWGPAGEEPQMEIRRFGNDDLGFEEAGWGYRNKLLGNGAAERNRIQKVLEDANIKLGSVLTDVFGVSGQKMLEALIVPDVVEIDKIAPLAHWRLEPKIEQIKKALDGKLTGHHRFLVELSRTHMELIENQLIRLDGEIDRRWAPHRQSLELRDSIAGIGPDSAKTILAEIGDNMSAYPDGEPLASWSGLCPGNNASAGKKFSGKTRNGNPQLRAALVDCAWAATRQRGSRFRAKSYVVKSRRGSKRAIIAVAHTLLLTIHAVLQTGKPYSEPDPPRLSNHKRLKKANDLCRKLQQLGFNVALKEKTKTA